MKRTNKAFTLVELIVVIIILSILGTIAFISLQGYSSSARDSTRISDMSLIKTSLELFQLDAGKYPIPTNGTQVTFSGGLVWTQGSFGESVFNNVTKVNKIPLDPSTDSQYTYSVTANGKEFEISGILEGGGLTFNQDLEKVNAGEIDASAIVEGTYNGIMTKTTSGTTCNILSIPTIIANDIDTSSDLVDIVTNNRLVFNGYKNLPATFRTSKFKYDGGFDFQPNNIVAYSDTGSCNELTNKTDSTARVALLKGIQEAYSGTILKSTGEIKNILGLVIDVNTPSKVAVNYAGNFVNNNLGGNITISNIKQQDLAACATNPGYTNANFVAGIPTLANESWQNTNPLNPCYYECTNGYTGSNCGTAPTACGAGMSSITLGNGQTWSCLNLGAGSVWNGSSTFSCNSTTDCSNRPSWVGDYFQWGNNAPTSNTLSYSSVNAGGYGPPPSQYYYDTTFRATYYWYTTSSPNLWGGVSNTLIARRGPCQEGWHVPSKPDWDALCSYLTGGQTCTNAASIVMSTLKLPYNGSRVFNTGDYTTTTITKASYWTSDYASSSNGIGFFINPINGTSAAYPSEGYGVRCIMN